MTTVSIRRTVKTVFADTTHRATIPIPVADSVDDHVNDLCKLIVLEHDPVKVQELLQQLNTALKDGTLHAQNKLVALSQLSPSPRTF